MIKSFFRWGYRKYCKDEEWELYKNHLGHLLTETSASFIKNLLTRVNGEKLRKELLASQNNYESTIDLLVKTFTEQNFYEKSDVAKQ